MIELVFFAAISRDGYLAGPNGNMAWAEKYLNVEEDYGFVELMSQTNAMLMGSKTFDTNLEAMGGEPQPLPCFVLTNSPMRYDGQTDPNVHLVHGEIAAVLAELESHVSGQMLILGGADVVQQAIGAGVLSQIQLFVAPEDLGDGLKLFSAPIDEALAAFELTDSRLFESGLNRLTYRKA
jgi:dihydrofolate reductase